MKAPKNIPGSWFGTELFVCITGLAIIYLLPKPYHGTSNFFTNLSDALWLTVIFSIPSTFLNWLYDKRGYAQSQRDWMKSPSSFMGRVGYILTGSIALWGLLIIGMVLAALVFGGLFALGQAAWST